MSAIYAVDTGRFVAMGQPLNQRFRAVRRFALRNELTFVLPQQVYDELTVEDTSVETPPIDEAIEEGWAEVADPLAFENPFVSRAMDGVRRFFAYADDRAQDEIERADSSLAADDDRRRGSGDGYRLIRPNNGHQKSWISPSLRVAGSCVCI